MEAIKTFVTVPENHRISIDVPEYIPAYQNAEVILIISNAENDYARKINEIKNAMSDKMFVADLQQVITDFEHIDFENWEK